MNMGEEEILISYRQAKNQKQQVQILADLNNVSNKEMAQFLADHGEKIDKRYLSQYLGPKKNDAPQPEAAEEKDAKISVYIAGPITDNPDYMQQFEDVEKWLAAYGFSVSNPARNKADNYKGYIDAGLTQLMQCSAICMLRGWSDSYGAKLEKTYADAVGLPELLIPERIWIEIEKKSKGG